MATMLTMQHQLAELRMLIDYGDPAQAEAEATFAAMIARIARGAEVAESIAKSRDDRTVARPEEAEQPTDLMAERMMLGTVEAYDGLA